MTHKPSINGIRFKNLHKFLVYLEQRSHIKKVLSGKNMMRIGTEY